MKTLKKVLTVILAVVFVLGVTPPITVQAATAPTLGVAEGYSVFGEAGITNTGALTYLWGKAGDGGFLHPGLLPGQVDSGVIDVGAGVAGATSTAYGLLAGWAVTDGGVFNNLAGVNTIGPGVYDVAATTLNGTLTLSGAGVYIIRSSSSLTTSGGGSVSLINGATACNVFWQIPIAMNIGAGSHIEGTIITQSAEITLGTGATLKGRALAHTQVTLLDNQITEPCAVVPSSEPQPATINVVKVVINDSGGNKVVSDFPLFVNGIPVVSGSTNTFPTNGGVYTVTETNNSNYTRTFSGDCDANGQLNLNGGQNKFCIITNNDIGATAPVVPPLIDVVKIASPLSLPAGPGGVTYTYTLRNIGTVPVSNITMVGDTCSPIVLISGDINNDGKLDLNETWVNTCSTTLSATHTNTIVATGWANGISATDIASATVVVGAGIVPPLIHVTKIPSPLALLSGPGMVTYTEKITNPGTVALNSVSIADDKCSPLTYISGDTNIDSKLDTTETWTFICKTNLTKTTTNTVSVSGEANGLTARDFAIATVVVAIPKLPKTGFPSQEENTMFPIVILSVLSVFSISLYFVQKNKTI